MRQTALDDIDLRVAIVFDFISIVSSVPVILVVGWVLNKVQMREEVLLEVVKVNPWLVRRKDVIFLEEHPYLIYREWNSIFHNDGVQKRIL